MFFLGLLIGLIIGIAISVIATSKEKEPEKPFRYENYYSDPDERIEKSSGYYYGIKVDKGIDREWLDPDPAAEDNNIFYGKKIVMTGDFNEIERNDAAMYISKLGGDVNTSISKRTDIVIVGDNPGPSKMVQIDEINLTRQPEIEIFDEDKLLSVIREHFDVG